MLRDASARCQTNHTPLGTTVKVLDRGVRATRPLTAGYTVTHEHTLPLPNGAVFLVETGRIGVKHAKKNGYVPLDAKDFVRSLVDTIVNPSEASAILQPYFDAIRALP
jgi:hypothetical protein